MRARSSLVDEAADDLRQMILSGQLQPGEFLPPQKELAARFEVGTSTIREAVQSLIAVGLLQAHPGKGTWVREDALHAMDTLIHPSAVKTRLGQLNARSLCEARAVVEVALSEFAALRATPEDLRKIRTALEAMRERVDDTTAFVKADLDFHVAVANAGHNDLLAQFYHLAHTLLEEVIHELISLPNVKQESIEIQGAVLEAIEGHNPHAARLAAEQHMQYIYRLLEQ
jgi:GntR family transcriptional regulator, transcriptional repressor for pyruvate dehydrogenase complex